MPLVHADLVLQGTLFPLDLARAVIAYLTLYLHAVLERAHWRLFLLGVLFLSLDDHGDPKEEILEVVPEDLQQAGLV